MYNNYSGDYRAGVTPLPISNREVKLRLADGTTTAGLWESRSSPDFILKPQLRNQLRFFYYIKAKQKNTTKAQRHEDLTGSSEGATAVSV